MVIPEIIAGKTTKRQRERERGGGEVGRQNSPHGACAPSGKCAISINKYIPLYHSLRGTRYSLASPGQRMLSSPTRVSPSLSSAHLATHLPTYPPTFYPPAASSASILLIFSSIRVNVLSVCASCRAGKLYYVNLEAL